MKGYLYSFILALFVLTGAWGPDAACAQGDEKSASHVVQGKVVDADGLPLVGVNVIVKNQPGLGTNTDIDGITGSGPGRTKHSCSVTWVMPPRRFRS